MRKALTTIATFALVFGFGSLGLAVSSTDNQANQPQVAGDATSNTTARFPTNKQNEPTIAVDPVNGKLIAGANDEQLEPPCGPGPVRGATAPQNDCSFFPGVGTSGVYTSNDGVAWTNRGVLPGYSDNNPGGTIQSDGDPVIVFGPKPTSSGGFSYANGARAYYANLASFTSGSANGNQAPELLAVSRSDDDGLSWSAPVIAAGGHGFKFNDKENIWADNNPASPFFGRVYISWTQFRGSVFTFFGEPITVAFSTDGGTTWSRPNQLSAAHNNRTVGGRQGSAVRTGPDGTVYVFWEDGDNKGNKMVFASSSDGGVHWTHASDIARLRDLPDPIPGANFRTDSFLSPAVDQNNGAIYAAWADATGGGHIVVTRSADKGASWSAPTTVSAATNGYAFFQGLDVAPNGRVDVGYQALKATSTTTYGTGNAWIDSYYTSRDPITGTWSAPVKVSSVSSDPAASAQNNLERQFWGDYNTLVSTNAAAYFIYTDSRYGVGCPAVDAYQHSIDAGTPIAKPAPPTDCPAQFGNSDVFVSKITP